MFGCERSGAGSKVANHMSLCYHIRKEINGHLDDVKTNQNKVVLSFDHGM